MTDQTTRHTTSLISLIAGLSLGLPASAADKMYEWRDDNGTRHMESTCPPECSRKDHYEIEKGRKKLIKATISSADRHAKEQERLDAQLAHEQKLRDKALVNTYSNEKEIDLARNRNLQQVEARINSINSQLKIADSNLAGLKKEADGYNAASKKIPASLQEDLDESQARLAKLQQDLEKARAEKAALDARYDADKARYKELTGK